MQADQLLDFREARQVQPNQRKTVYAMFARAEPIEVAPDRASPCIAPGTQTELSSKPEPVDLAADLARCFLRLANLPNFALDRLSRYEAVLWRQVGQILFALDALDRRKPQDRRRRSGIGSRQTLLARILNGASLFYPFNAVVIWASRPNLKSFAEVYFARPVLTAVTRLTEHQS
jgi:hypothetical protein